MPPATVHQLAAAKLSRSMLEPKISGDVTMQPKEENQTKIFTAERHEKQNYCLAGTDEKTTIPTRTSFALERRLKPHLDKLVESLKYLNPILLYCAAQSRFIDDHLLQNLLFSNLRLSHFRRELWLLNCRGWIMTKCTKIPEPQSY